MSQQFADPQQLMAAAMQHQNDKVFQAEIRKELAEIKEAIAALTALKEAKAPKIKE